MVRRPDPEKRKVASDLDGVERTVAAEQDINDAFAAFARSRRAKDVLGYLRSITLNRVGGPHMTDAELRHREGMRHLYTIIEQRIERGQK